MIDPNTGTLRPPFALHVAYDPGTIVLGLTLASGAVGAVGAIQQGNAAAEAASYNAQVAERNASAARQQTAADIASQARDQAKKLGAVRATYGANGLDFSGTALDVFEGQALDAEYDKALTKYKGDIRVAGYRDEAKLSSMNASASSSAGYIGAASKVLGAGASYYANTKGLSVSVGGL